MSNAHASTTPARAARRQLLIDRWAEKLERCPTCQPHAEARARDLLTDLDDLGFTLPAALDDPPPLRPDRAAADDSPGRREFAEARAALAARRTTSRDT